MSDQLAAPVRQFLQWVTERPRTYADVMDEWRSSCPRLTVWEDASIAGYVALEGGPVEADGIAQVGQERVFQPALGFELPCHFDPPPSFGESRRFFQPFGSGVDLRPEEAAPFGPHERFAVAFRPLAFRQRASPQPGVLELVFVPVTPSSRRRPCATARCSGCATTCRYPGWSGLTAPPQALTTTP